MLLGQLRFGRNIFWNIRHMPDNLSTVVVSSLLISAVKLSGAKNLPPKGSNEKPFSTSENVMCTPKLAHPRTCRVINFHTMLACNAGSLNANDATHSLAAKLKTESHSSRHPRQQDNISLLPTRWGIQNGSIING